MHADGAAEPGRAASYQLSDLAGNILAGAPGFEPGIARPKPAALPLGYAPSHSASATDTSGPVAAMQDSLRPARSDWERPKHDGPPRRSCASIRQDGLRSFRCRPRTPDQRRQDQEDGEEDRGQGQQQHEPHGGGAGVIGKGKRPEGSQGGHGGDYHGARRRVVQQRRAGRLAAAGHQVQTAVDAQAE